MRRDTSIKGLQRRIARLERHMPDHQPPPGRTDIIAMMCGDRPLMDLFHNLLGLLAAPEDEHAPPPTQAQVRDAFNRYEARIAELDAGAPAQPDPVLTTKPQTT